MKKLFFILTVLFFLLCGGLADKSRADDGKNPFNPGAGPCAELISEPEIVFKTSYGHLRYDFSMNQKELTELGKQYGIVEQGLFASGLAVIGVNWEIQLETAGRVADDGTICVVPEKLEVFIGYQDPVIFISNQLVPDSCDYNVVMRHEQTHHQINAAALEYFIPGLRRSVSEISGHISPVRVGGISEIDEATNRLTEDYIKEISPLIQHFKKELMQEQGKLDNHTNYKFENDLCRKFNRRP